LGKIILVIGGARSGKSRFAQAQAEAGDSKLVYIATAQAFDAEMTERISRHQSDRGARWQTVECPLDLGRAIRDNQGAGVTLLVDCLTLWLSNVMLNDYDITAAISDLESALSASASDVILVSNEVGQGIVPDNALARRFRDEAGRLNQVMAEIADDVWFVIAGLPQRLK
jgi:adenosylcobinamide kinase/adenosylcobinamide-phosphate guanylyltransferase